MAQIDALQTPKQLPNSHHDVIVHLEEVHLALSDIDSGPNSHQLIVYHRVTSAQDIRERIQCASIVIATQSHINAESLGEAPFLRCVITPTVGTNHLDLAELQRRGIAVFTCPGTSADAVAEHALSLYFATRRKTVTFHHVVRDIDDDGKNLWKREGSAAYKMRTANGSPPRSLVNEVVAIFGHGYIGKRLHKLCEGLGMKVVIAGRKASVAQQSDNSDRVPFDDAIQQATVLFLTLPKTPETTNMIDAPQLNSMRQDAVIVNVSRGGIVNEAALVQALQQDKISGAAADVFDTEPATSVENSALLAPEAQHLNLTLSPHVGYYTLQTEINMRNAIRDHIKNHITSRK